MATAHRRQTAGQNRRTSSSRNARTSAIVRRALSSQCSSSCEDLAKGLILSDGIDLSLQAPDQFRHLREPGVNLVDGLPLSAKCVEGARHDYLPHE